ncbi:unnamed protein product [Prunus brigantina]
MPEEPGSFKHYCELVGPINISEFKYRYNSDKQAVVLYTVLVCTQLLNLKKCKSAWSLLDSRLASSQKVTWLKITCNRVKLGQMCWLESKLPGARLMNFKPVGVLLDMTMWW